MAYVSSFSQTPSQTNVFGGTTTPSNVIGTGVPQIATATMRRPAPVKPGIPTVTVPQVVNPAAPSLQSSSAFSPVVLSIGAAGVGLLGVIAFKRFRRKPKTT